MSADLKQNKINPEGTIYLINNFTLIVFYVRYMETALKKKRKRKLTKNKNKIRTQLLRFFTADRTSQQIGFVLSSSP